ncbi:MAG: DNA polymerase III subunit delta [Gammaproteobacteria bacterium]|nr:DNA polymerase III subunit delta [Gammaproteobacteria bacterium]
MQVKAQDLVQRLESGLLPIYLISGDETLLVEEACDAVVAAARRNGFSERSIHYVETGFRWHDLSHDAASLSLFAQKKVLDVRVPVKKFDREAGAALREWCERVAADVHTETLLLLRTGRLEPGQRKSAWFKALEKIGSVTLIWPMSPDQLPRWLAARARLLNLSFEPGTLQYLSDRVEGNLLSAAQELDKLALLNLPQPVDFNGLVATLEDTSRYTTFDLLDAMMGGECARVVKILDVLRCDGVALFAILGVLVSQLRRLGVAYGAPPARQKLLQQFAKRIKGPGKVLAECAVIDQQGKGQLLGDPWVSLETLLLRLAGAKQMPLPSEAQAWLG